MKTLPALLALLALVAALAASPANAQTHQRVHGYRFITDTLGGDGHPHQLMGYRFITDTLGGNGGPSAVSVPASSGFNWGDAGIGASAAAGAIFVLLGTTVVVRRRTHVAI